MGLVDLFRSIRRNSGKFTPFTSNSSKQRKDIHPADEGFCNTQAALLSVREIEESNNEMPSPIGVSRKRRVFVGDSQKRAVAWADEGATEDHVTESSSTDYKIGELDTRMERIYHLHCTGQLRPPAHRRNEYLTLPRPKKESAWPQAGDKSKRAVPTMPRQYRRASNAVISLRREFTQSVTRTLRKPLQQATVSEVSYDPSVSDSGFKAQSSVSGFGESTTLEELRLVEVEHISYTDDEDSFDPYRPAEPLFTFTPRKNKGTGCANADASSAIH
ncbi:hypothetical protein AAVH_11671 [Aphelenchoides avenae]|nr:hypothetical protein AAVH_11671 [Aphelenchus avenae]